MYRYYFLKLAGSLKLGALVLVVYMVFQSASRNTKLRQTTRWSIASATNEATMPLADAKPVGSTLGLHFLS